MENQTKNIKITGLEQFIDSFYFLSKKNKSGRYQVAAGCITADTILIDRRFFKEDEKYFLKIVCDEMLELELDDYTDETNELRVPSELANEFVEKMRQKNEML